MDPPGLQHPIHFPPFTSLQGCPCRWGRRLEVRGASIPACWWVLCPTDFALSVSLQAKESWEMDTKEKLEQAAIVKEKGTMYFKVCERGDTRTRAGSSEQILDIPRHH